MRTTTDPERADIYPKVKGRTVRDWDLWLEGWKDGWVEGWREGVQQGMAEFLLRLLDKKFGPSALQKRDLVSNAYPALLLVWGSRVLTAERLEEVFDD